MQDKRLRYIPPGIYCNATRTRTRRKRPGSSRPRTGDDTMAYARIADPLHHFVADTPKPKNRLGFFRRAFDAMADGRRRSAEREIAAYLEGSGKIPDRRGRTPDRPHPVFIGALLKPARPAIRTFSERQAIMTTFPLAAGYAAPAWDGFIPHHCRRDGCFRSGIRSVRRSRAAILGGAQPLSARRLTLTRQRLPRISGPTINRQPPARARCGSRQ